MQVKVPGNGRQTAVNKQSRAQKMRAGGVEYVETRRKKPASSIGFVGGFFGPCWKFVLIADGPLVACRIFALFSAYINNLFVCMDTYVYM